MTSSSLSASPLPLVRPVWSPAAPVDADTVAELSSALALPSSICKLLVRRGYTDADRARGFLRPHRAQIHTPEGLADVEVAIERLSNALDDVETVLVHGDYDVDGICATALLVRGLRMMGLRAVPFVPHRLRDGYDLSAAGVAAAQRAGASLILTADCGTVAHEAVRQANLAGIDVIVTDHHTPGASLPAAVAVLNPNRADCGYPEQGLAGAGVAYKLLLGLAEWIGFPVDRLSALLDMVAIATIADLAPLTAENRALVRWGLAVLDRTPNPGLRALIHKCGLGAVGSVTSGQIGYVLAPRLNAAGRMGDAMRGVRLLLTDDPREADQLAEELELENGRRRELDQATLSDAMRMLERDYDPDRDWGVVLASERWHPGVIGIVASRVVERIHRPTVLIAVGHGEGKGSGRSIPGFHLQAAFTECESFLLRYGGHRAAAGCSLHPHQIDSFREAFNAAVHRELQPPDLLPRLRLDDEIPLSEATGQFVKLLSHFAPFGIGNATPVFAAYGVELAGSPRIVGKGHLKLVLIDRGARLDAIGFGMADRMPECSASRLDVAFKLEENRWTGRDGRLNQSVQARLVDLRAAS